MIIAVDGTLASGKGTLARHLAHHYNLPCMDTGRLYRTAGAAAMDRGVALDDVEALVDIIDNLDSMDFVDQQLRSEQAGQAASRIATIPQVRAALLAAQRAFACQPRGAVLDGRDIGTVVCPDADVKLWVDASVEVRARRRFHELCANGMKLTFAQVLEHLQERDCRDRMRTHAPMKAAADAVLIDTSDLDTSAVVAKARAVIDSAIVRET